MKRLVLASSNAGKLAELQPLLADAGYELVTQRELGLSDAVELLEENLQEEEAALNKLKAIASEFDVTDEADQAEDTEEDAEGQPATPRR